ESIELWPAQRCRNHDCYRGTADTAYQNIHVIREHAPTEVLVLAGNHLCRMNYARLIDEHRRRAADVTLAYMELPLADAGQGGVLSTDTDHWVRTFAEKPPAAANGHGTAERGLVSLGVYVFDTNSLIDLLSQLPPARFSGRGVARESIVCAGCEIFGEVRHSVLSVGCEVGAHTVIEDSVILTNVRIGRGCRIRRAIVDAECAIPDGTVIDA